MPEAFGCDDFMCWFRPMQTVAVHPPEMAGPTQKCEQDAIHGAVPPFISMTQPTALSDMNASKVVEVLPRGFSSAGTVDQRNTDDCRARSCRDAKSGGTEHTEGDQRYLMNLRHGHLDEEVGLPPRTTRVGPAEAVLYASWPSLCRVRLPAVSRSLCPVEHAVVPDNTGDA